MLSEHEIEQLFLEGTIRKFETAHILTKKKFDIYYYKLEYAPSVRDVCEKNKIKMFYNEWYEEYSERVRTLEENNINNVVVLISKEDAQRFGL